MTNGLGNTLASLADVAIDTRAGEETGPSTMTFAASLVTVAAIARVLAGSDRALVMERTAEESEAVAGAIERLLADETLPDRLGRWHGGPRDRLMILARGPARAAAEMGALTLKEAVGIPVESLETAQFRHGPLELVGPDLAVMMIATEPETVDLDLRFAAELHGDGAARARDHGRARGTARGRWPRPRGDRRADRARGVDRSGTAPRLEARSRPRSRPRRLLPGIEGDDR